jgi:tRNA-Thr(GGU) m(6)t(6)A37 methyltransferase TsaA
MASSASAWDKPQDDDMKPSSLSLQPIGIFRSDKKYPYEAASQGSLDQSDEVGLIELAAGQNFEQALKGLSEMSHVWVLFWFHHNENWKPQVKVPRGSDEKQGVFATRSPYRPNPIGLSLVEIVQIEERKIWVKGFDLLDGTPILDLKPYHPEADTAASPRLGWMENLEADEFIVQTTAEFDEQANFLFEGGVKQIVSFAKQQLRFDPFNSEKKRVKMDAKEGEARLGGVLSYRTWRIEFKVENGTQVPGTRSTIRLTKIRSGYSEDELRATEDRWADKQLHREFVAVFGR